MEKISFRTMLWDFAVEIGPWIFPMLGSIFLSVTVSYWGTSKAVLCAIIALLLILVGTVPLGIRVSGQSRARTLELRARDRESATLKMVAQMVPKVPVSNSQVRSSREDIAKEARRSILEYLYEDIYADIDGLRVIFFELVSTEEGERFSPAVDFGCTDTPAKVHAERDPRYYDLKKLVESSDETSSEWGIENRHYKSFASACVVGGDGEIGYGLVTMDTTSDYRFGCNDEQNLLVAARLIGMFLDAALRGKHTK